MCDWGYGLELHCYSRSFRFLPLRLRCLFSTSVHTSEKHWAALTCSSLARTVPPPCSPIRIQRMLTTKKTSWSAFRTTQVPTSASRTTYIRRENGFSPAFRGGLAVPESYP